ncbi:hypothetical protein [Microbacterium sp. NPDC087589]|uniref:hypothetical protein n=1 Tax=Microbacterium sp. NPDC087589 TaxID=3364191 RepID=UPI003810AB58
MLLCCLAGLGGIFALGVLFTEDLREDAVSWVALFVIAVLSFGAEMLRRHGRRVVERDSARMGTQ